MLELRAISFCLRSVFAQKGKTFFLGLWEPTLLSQEVTWVRGLGCDSSRDRTEVGQRKKKSMFPTGRKKVEGWPDGGG